MNTQIMEQLKILAHSGSHPKVWISAALVYRNKIISYGVNHMKSHPFQRKYSRNSESIYWHAETLAIYNADKKLNFDKFDKSTIYVARMKYDSTEKLNFIEGLASPCDGCLSCIKDYGIRKVIYTMDRLPNTKDNYGVILL